MKRTPVRRSSLFLLECIIAILFFIITATVCIQIFAKSYTISKKSEDLTMAVHITSSYVEEFRGGKVFPEELHIYYDDSWTLCDETASVHTLMITMSSQSDMVTGRFSMDDIYEISTTKYIGGGVQ